MRLYLVQRGTALLMMPLIVGHLVVIFYASSRGVSATEILGRTTGSVGWAVYYGAFVVLAAAHAAIGLRTIAMEWGGLSDRAASAVMWGAGFLLFTLGLRAVFAVIAPGSLA
ncbi:MAG: succinate dehydrogenase [Hyphomicrobiaceae bacterium]